MIAGPRALAAGHLRARLTLCPADLDALRELLAVAVRGGRQWVAIDDDYIERYKAGFRGTLHGVDVYVSTHAPPVDVLELVAALGILGP